MQKSTIKDGLGLSVDLVDFGARITAINFNGTDVALSYDNDTDYLTDNYYLGATIGPIANRVSQGRFNLGEQLFQMPINHGDHCLHSGNVGFDQETWSLVKAKKNSVHYELAYPLNRVGLEGRLMVNAIYTVENGALSIEYSCISDTTTYLNMTNHVYLNIDGTDSIVDHEFELACDSAVEVDNESIPTGNLIDLNAPFKYEIMRSSKTEFAGVCDHHFNIINSDSDHRKTLKTMLTARSKNNNIELEVSSNSPGFQFYTGKFLSQPFLPSAGFCVEAQLAPDAINQEHLESPLLAGGEERTQSIVFQFRQRD